MIRRFREWLFRWLPPEIKNEYIKEYGKLKAENEQLKQENEQLRSYIDGMQYALRSRARVYITNEVSK